MLPGTWYVYRVKLVLLDVRPYLVQYVPPQSTSHPRRLHRGSRFFFFFLVSGIIVCQSMCMHRYIPQDHTRYTCTNSNSGTTRKVQVPGSRKSGVSKPWYLVSVAVRVAIEAIPFNSRAGEHHSTQQIKSRLGLRDMSMVITVAMYEYWLGLSATATLLGAHSFKIQITQLTVQLEEEVYSFITRKKGKSYGMWLEWRRVLLCVVQAREATRRRDLHTSRP